MDPSPEHPDLTCLAKAIRQVMENEEPEDTETELMELEADAEAFERGFEVAFGLPVDQFTATVRHCLDHLDHLS